MTLFSILGDSISTYENCNPKGFAVYYEGPRREASGVVSADQTWWSILADTLGGTVLKNGSFSGSLVEGPAFPAADSSERIDALSSGETDPDVIIAFIGINDYGWGGFAGQASCAKKLFAENRAGTLPQNVDYDLIEQRRAAKAPADAAKRFGSAYASMLARAKKRYPHAQVWCCTLVPGRLAGERESSFIYQLRGTALSEYNEEIRIAAKRNGCICLDIAALGYDYEAIDGTHPTRHGMLQLANLMETALRRALAENGEDLEKPDMSAQLFPEEFVSTRLCDKASCIGCACARDTSDTWSLVCEKALANKQG